MKRIISSMLLAATLALALPQAPPAAAQEPPPDPGFSMLIGSDPQFSFWRGGEYDRLCKDHPSKEARTECDELQAVLANTDVALAMRGIQSLGQWPAELGIGGGSPVAAPAGLIMNGDLTNYGHKSEWEAYDALYGGLPYQRYEGLGNHDYENNTTAHGGSCYYSDLNWADKNRCAKEAVWRMIRTIYSLPNVVNRDVPGLISVYHEGGYEARIKVTYDLDGARRTPLDEIFTLGTRRTLVVPSRALNVQVFVEENTGLIDWSDFLDPKIKWRTVIDKTFAQAPVYCAKIYGTTLDPKSSADKCPAWPDGTSGSLAYAFEIGDYHFVQLQNHPSYSLSLPNEPITGIDFASSPGFNVTPSWDWLRQDLERATAQGKRIVINLHDYEADMEPLKGLIRDTNVVAIFAGHIHARYGEQYTVETNFGTMPVYYSGAGECRTFLLADFHQDYLNVSVVKANGFVPAFMTTPEPCETRELWQEVGDTLVAVTGTGYHGSPTDKGHTIEVIEDTTFGTYVFDRPMGDVSLAQETPQALEGAPVTFRAGASDPDGDPISFAWDFGDGHTATGDVVTHTFADNGTYTVRVVASEQPIAGNPFTRTSEATLEVTVENVAPTVTASGATIDEGGTGTISGTVADPGLSEALRAEIFWHSELSELLEIGPDGAFSIQRAFADDNPSGTPSDLHQATIVVTDKDGATASATVEIVVNNLPPTVELDFFADEWGAVADERGGTLPGLAVRSVATVGDPGAEDTLTAQLDWGDGTSAALDVTAATSSQPVSHTYSAPGVYTVTLTATDDDTGSAAASSVVRVLSPAEAVTSARTAIEVNMSFAGVELGDTPARRDLERAFAALSNPGGRKGSEGAAELLAAGEHDRGVEQIREALEALDRAEARESRLLLGEARSLLTRTGKSEAVTLLERLRAVADEPRELERIERAEAQLALAERALERGDEPEALDRYYKAVRLLKYPALKAGVY
ncbi:MAG TPA: PKD domain-containing protein [Chloroflexaceae bacterium]|nr:PKD domain-containing protein [Chloroflexaceae bacterium]